MQQGAQFAKFKLDRSNYGSRSKFERRESELKPKDTRKKKEKNFTNNWPVINIVVAAERCLRWTIMQEIPDYFLPSSTSSFDCATGRGRIVNADDDPEQTGQIQWKFLVPISVALVTLSTFFVQIVCAPTIVYWRPMD